MTKSRTALWTNGMLAVILLLVIALLVSPMTVLLAKSVSFHPFWQGFVSVLSKETARIAIRNSVTVTAVSAFVACVTSYFYAYVVEFKLNPKARSFFRVFAILTMLVPSVTHGIVIIYLFGKTGILTSFLHLNINIYGPTGIVVGSFFYAFPAAFLIFSQAFANMDSRLFDHAKAIGAGPVRRFFDIILPITRYSIFSAFAVCFTMIFTDYGVPVSVGGTFPTLSVLFYKNVIGRLDFETGAVYSVFLLIPALIVYSLDIFVFSKKQIAGKHTGRPDTGKFLLTQKLIFVFLTLCIVMCIGVITIAPFVTNWPHNLAFTMAHFKAINYNGKLIRLIKNSFLIAAGTATLGTIISFAAGYLYVRSKAANKPLKKLTHAMYTVTLAVPGLALGLSYALFFKGTPIYNTYLILILVNTIHFFGSPYMMSISHFKLLDPNLEHVCYSLGGSFRQMMIDILIPASKRLILDIWAYFFTNSMITISAISLLYSPRIITAAIQVTTYNDQGAAESAVAVSFIILITNFIIKMTQYRRMHSEAAE